LIHRLCSLFFIFTDTSTNDIYTLSLHDALPISPEIKNGWSLVKIKGFGIVHSEIFTRQGKSPSVKFPRILGIECVGIIEKTTDRSEEHTSELQSRFDLVCRLLLEKKK